MVYARGEFHPSVMHLYSQWINQPFRHTYSYTFVISLTSTSAEKRCRFALFLSLNLISLIESSALLDLTFKAAASDFFFFPHPQTKFIASAGKSDSLSARGVELSIAKARLPLAAKQQTDKSTNKALGIIFTVDNKINLLHTQIVIVLICLSVFYHIVCLLMESFINVSHLSPTSYHPRLVNSCYCTRNWFTTRAFHFVLETYNNFIGVALTLSSSYRDRLCIRRA